jgi:transcriptional regulator with XRE-family HTH domain
VTKRAGKFGEFVRKERLEKEIGLREMAKMIRVSPTYLSKVERDEFPPPAEDKVRKIAEIIGCDSDELLARAGRVSSDLSEIIKQHPRELAQLLRATQGFSVGVLMGMVHDAEKAKDE